MAISVDGEYAYQYEYAASLVSCIKPACTHDWTFLATIGRILEWHCSEREEVAGHVMLVQAQGILKCCKKLSRGKCFASSEIGQPDCGTVVLKDASILGVSARNARRLFHGPRSPANESGLMQKLAGMCYASGPTCTFSKQHMRRKQHLR